MSELITLEIENHIADIRLNRPEKYNALNPEMYAALIDAGDAVLNNSSVRAAVLSGNGRGFCAGLDFGSFEGLESGAPVEKEIENSPANASQYVAYVWRQIKVPVIAAMHGGAFGMGMQIALAADIRLVTPDVKLALGEINFGLIPDVCGTLTLRDLVGLDVAKELTYTGKAIDGKEAVQLGLATRICDDPFKEAMALATQIAGKSPDAIRAAKEILHDGWRGDVSTCLKLEQTLQKRLLGSPNQIEAVKANFEKRAPDFIDPK